MTSGVAYLSPCCISDGAPFPVVKFTWPALALEMLLIALIVSLLLCRKIDSTLWSVNDVIVDDPCDVIEEPSTCSEVAAVNVCSILLRWHVVVPHRQISRQLCWSYHRSDNVFHRHCHSPLSTRLRDKKIRRNHYPPQPDSDWSSIGRRPNQQRVCGWLAAVTRVIDWRQTGWRQCWRLLIVLRRRQRRQSANIADRRRRRPLSPASSYNSVGAA